MFMELVNFLYKPLETMVESHWYKMNVGVNMGLVGKLMDGLFVHLFECVSTLFW